MARDGTRGSDPWSCGIPELHLMLGVGDKLMKILEKTVFETEKEGKDFIDDFLDKQNISKKGYMDS